MCYFTILNDSFRITGLDPASEWFEELPKEGRLDKDDANFVDVIHSNAGESGEDYHGIRFPIGKLPSRKRHDVEHTKVWLKFSSETIMKHNLVSNNLTNF